MQVIVKWFENKKDTQRYLLSYNIHSLAAELKAKAYSQANWTVNGGKKASVGTVYTTC